MAAPMPPSPPPTGPTGSSAPAATASTSGAPPPPASGSASTAGPSVKKPLEPLTGFRAALEHTGVPRGVLTWRPRMPSRNWLIFWSVVGSVSYVYWDDRRKCRLIKAEYIAKVEQMGKEPLDNSLALPRKVTVWAAKWPEDDDADRGARYFRKYVKPYLVAAGIDYTYPKNPLYGSVTRQVRANILRQRRETLGLQDPAVASLNLPVMSDGRTEMQREADGGVILVGRPSLKEYLEGVRRGWSNGVGDWNWEKEIEERLKHDGVFEGPPAPGPEAPVSAGEQTDAAAPGSSKPPAAPGAAPGGLSGLSFLSRPQMPLPPQGAAGLGGGPSSTPAQIPAHMHEPPNPLPPTPPVLLLPFTSHLGFRQIPYMIYDFFTEHKRVRAGAEAAYALIMGNTRPFVPVQQSNASNADSLLQDDPAASGSSLSPAATAPTSSDLAFGTDSERFYKSDFLSLPTRIEKARGEYYKTLAERLDSVRKLMSGEREMTSEEKTSTKGPETEQELKDERQKKELRWMGQLEGWEIVKPDSAVAWDPKWEGWLRVYEAPSGAQADEKETYLS